MLEQLVEELSRYSYDALVIAGDVYDRTIPPAEAVDLFSSFLIRLRSELPDLSVFIIPGNHDSARRLSFANRILGQQQVFINGDAEESFKPIILEKGGNRLAFFLMPFLLPGNLQPAHPAAESASKSSADDTAGPELDLFADTDTPPSPSEPLLYSQADLAREASRRFDDIRSLPEYRDIPAVLVAHLFMTGGVESSSERVFIGSAERVPSSLFSGFAYVALGHLHKKQRVHDHIWYSGAPLAYAFDEADCEKCFLRVEIPAASSDKPVTVTPVPVQPARPVERLSGAFDDFYHGSAFDAHAGSYLEITLTDANLIANPMNLLRTKFPFLLSIRQGEWQKHRQETVRENTPAPKGRDLSEDFSAFQTLLYGTVDAQKKKLFDGLLKDAAHES